MHVGQYRSQVGPRLSKPRSRRKPRTEVTMHAVFSDGHVLRSVMSYAKIKLYKDARITHAWRVSMRRADGSVSEVGGFSTSLRRAETDMRSWVRLAKPRPVIFAGVAEAVEGDVEHSQK